MPIVAADDPVFDKLPSEVDVLLPDMQELSADVGQVGMFGLLNAYYSTKSAEIWQQSSQLALGGVLQNVGIPIRNMFDVALDAMEIDAVDSVDAVLTTAKTTLTQAWAVMNQSPATGGETMASTVETGMGPAINMAAMVPVAGWVIKIAWNLGKAIYGIAKLIKAQNQEEAERVYPQSSFNPQFDNLVINDVIRRVRSSKDWSRLFAPPGLGVGVGQQPPFGTVKVERGRELFRRDSKVWGAQGYTGMVPGTGWLHQGIHVHKGTIREIGNLLLPSTRSLCVWLWKHIIGHNNTPTPAMYCVDQQVVALWERYIHDLHVYIYEDAGKYITSTEQQNIMSVYNTDNDGLKIFGWGTSVKPKSNEQDRYQPVREGKILRQRQMAFLDTLMCAYVDDSYAAIANDTQLRERHDQRRRDLLEHPARCDVDLANVPDQVYKEALRDSGVGAPICQQASLDIAARVPPVPQRVPPNGQQGAAGVGGGETAGPSFPIAVPFVALAAGGYYAWKKGLLRPARLPKLKLPGL